MGRCHYCGCSLLDDGNEDMSPTIDHVVPRSRGGRNHKANKRIACKKCNNEKGDMTVAEYQEFVARMAMVMRFRASAEKQIMADILGRRRHRVRARRR